MGIPSYGSLGKEASGVLGGYNVGAYKLDVKTKSRKTGAEFSCSGTQKQEDASVSGNFSTTYKYPPQGLTFTEKFNTENVIGAEIAVSDVGGVKGLNVSTDMTFTPGSTDKTAHVKSSFVNDQANVNCDFDVTGGLLNASIVTGYEGWLAGASTAYKTQEGEISGHKLALGYMSGDFVLHTNVEDGQKFGASIYQKLKPRLEAGININWTSSAEDPKFAIGAKYVLDCDSTVKTKIDNDGILGFNYTQIIRDGVTLTSSILIDGKNFEGGGHKFGIGLSFG